MDSRIRFISKAAPLMLVLFIDSVGLGLIIPVLSGLIFNPESHFLKGAFATPFMHNLVYGGVLGVFMFCWFFGSAVLGDLSDKIGRKNALLICLFGAFLSYLISAISISMQSIGLLLFGRVINGLTSGSQPIAQAAVLDMSHPLQKARNMSYMFFAMSLGFILGPLLGGILSDPKIISWFNYQTPFYFAAFIAFANIVLLQFFFNETFVTKAGKISLNFLNAIHLFISAFQHPKVKKLAILYTIFIFGWSSFYSFSSAFLMKTYALSSTDISLYMGMMGVGFALGNVIIEAASTRLSNAKIFFYAVLFAGIISLLTVMLNSALAAWILVIPMAAVIATTGPAVLTLLSEQVGPEAQGWAMGVTGSIMALIWGINGIVVGALATWGAGIPIYIAGICLLITAALSPYFLKNLG